MWISIIAANVTSVASHAGSAVPREEQDFTLHACFGVIRFLCSQLSSCGLRLDLQTGFSSGLGFCCIYWISSALSSLTRRSVHLSIWLTACGDRASELFTARLFALARRCAEIPDCEVKSTVSYTDVCQSQIVLAEAQLPEHVVCGVEQCLLWVHIVCSTWHQSMSLREAAHWPSEAWRCLACGVRRPVG